MDNQIVEIVSKVVGGSGISWPKPASLKRLSAYEKTRVLILRHLEERLGVRTSNDVVLATNAQITPVVSAAYVTMYILIKIIVSALSPCEVCACLKLYMRVCVVITPTHTFPPRVFPEPCIVVYWTSLSTYSILLRRTSLRSRRVLSSLPSLSSDWPSLSTTSQRPSRLLDSLLGVPSVSARH